MKSKYGFWLRPTVWPLRPTEAKPTGVKFQTQVSREPLNETKQVRGAKYFPEHEEDACSINTPATPAVFRQIAKNTAREARRHTEQLQLPQTAVTPEPSVAQHPVFFRVYKIGLSESVGTRPILRKPAVSAPRLAATTPRLTHANSGRRQPGFSTSMNIVE